MPILVRNDATGEIFLFDPEQMSMTPADADGTPTGHAVSVNMNTGELSPLASRGQFF